MIYDPDESLSINSQTVTSFHHLFLSLDFLEKTYIPSLQNRLYESHKCVTDALRELDIPHLHRSAGLYVWTDFRRVSENSTFEGPCPICVTVLNQAVQVVFKDGHSLNPFQIASLSTHLYLWSEM